MTLVSKYKLLSPDSTGQNKDRIDGGNLEDGLRRIQTLLAEWPRMENVAVLITGLPYPFQMTIAGLRR